MTPAPKKLPAGFVYVPDAVPDALLEIRYYSTYNFIGDRIRGYERPTALLTVEAAEALRAVSDDVKKRGFRLKIFDAYRPRRAVAHFMEWAKRPDDTRMKEYFYPRMEKAEIFARGLIAEKSAHSRGSTVDLTLFDMATGCEVDMGTPFDRFGSESRSDWCGDPETRRYTGKLPDDMPYPGTRISAAQFRSRMTLREAMLRRKFVPIAGEWWHFTLADEPFPESCFDHPVR